MQPQSAQYDVTLLIRRLFRGMAELTDNHLKAHGLSAADRAVLGFLDRDEMLSVPEIAARHRVSRQHIQVTVNTLLEDGFLESHPNPRHKRSPLFALTPVGTELFRKVRAAESELLDTMFAGIEPADIECTRRTLKTLYFENLKHGDTAAPG